MKRTCFNKTQTIIKIIREFHPALIINYFRMKTARLSIILFFLTGLFIQVYSQTEASTAKATFIYNFTRFIEWPKKANSSNFIIQVYGSDDVYNELTQFTNNKFVGSQQIKVIKVNKIDDIKNCDLLFVGFDKSNKLKDIIALLNNSNTLIISEKNGALQEGSGINFVLNDDKLSYEIKPVNLTKAGLKLSSSIIKYAKGNNS